MSYDISQICLNGHVINSEVQRYPDFNKEYCPDCGERTIIQCPSCKEYFRGEYKVDGVIEIGFELEAPKFCEFCGSPYPWTESALSAAKELADGLESLNDDEKEDLKQNIDDMVKDTPRTTVAVQKFKKLLEKAGDDAPAMFKVALINVLTQGALHALGWR